MVRVIPVVRVSEGVTWSVMKHSPIVFVRLQDFISRRSFKFNSFYDKAVRAGGLHKFLGFDGVIVLSLVMRDDMIAHCDAPRYALACGVLKPDAITSVDAETYETEYATSRKEVTRCLEQTKMLMGLCPGLPVLGQVKGCNLRQIRDHCLSMKAMGINEFILHAGDFLRHGDSSMIQVLRSYALAIRPHARMLLLYGMGSPKQYLEFSFADAFVTYKHCVSANHGLKHTHHNTIKCAEKRATLILDNYLALKRFARGLAKQKKLFTHGGVCIWEEEFVAEEVPTPETVQVEAS